jgi:hypothetical protein
MRRHRPALRRRKTICVLHLKRREAMVFILSGDGRNEDVVAAYDRYRNYLQSTREKFPSSAYALATSDWYHNFNDHRCPHDAWLESVEIGEDASGVRHEERTAALKIRLLGAYHDGHIELRYPRVFSYALRGDAVGRGHRDWLYDELRLSEQDRLIHEIEWCGTDDTAHWFIEAADLEFRWIPRPAQLA